jgi:hypothetical protein
MTQAVVIDEVLPKRMSVFDQVITQQMVVEDRPDAFIGGQTLIPQTESAVRRAH